MVGWGGDVPDHIRVLVSCAVAAIAVVVLILSAIGAAYLTECQASKSNSSKGDSSSADSKLCGDHVVRYCGYTPEEWKMVADGGFDVRVSDGGHDDAKINPYKSKLLKVEPGLSSPFSTDTGLRFTHCHVVREKGHPQPVFGRNVRDGDRVLVHCKTGEEYVVDASGVGSWEALDWFINLSGDG